MDDHADEMNPNSHPPIQPVEAILVESPLSVAEPSKPRVWTAISVPLMAIFAATVVSGIVAACAMLIVSHGQLDPDQMMDHLADLAHKPWGLLVLVLPGQLVFLACAVVAAGLSPLGVSRRLDLKHGQLPKWMWIVLAIATPSIGFVVAIAMHKLDIQMSEQLRAINEMVVGRKGWGLLNTVFLVALVPGCVEEVLFRGYLQSRLLSRWSPWAAILISAVIFAIAHLDPLHVIAVFPIGIWLGYVAWKAGSIWPAIMGHIANNGFSIVMAQFQGDVAENVSTLDYIVFVPSGLAMIASLLLLRHYGNTAQEEDPSIAKAPFQ